MRGQDPRELAMCACPRIGATDCIETRSGTGNWDDEDGREECECSCHEPDEDDYDDGPGDALGERKMP